MVKFYSILFKNILFITIFYFFCIINFVDSSNSLNDISQNENYENIYDVEADLKFKKLKSIMKKGLKAYNTYKKYRSILPIDDDIMSSTVCTDSKYKSHYVARCWVPRGFQLWKQGLHERTAISKLHAQQLCIQMKNNYGCEDGCFIEYDPDHARKLCMSGSSGMFDDDKNNNDIDNNINNDIDNNINNDDINKLKNIIKEGLKAYKKYRL